MGSLGVGTVQLLGEGGREAPEHSEGGQELALSSELSTRSTGPVDVSVVIRSTMLDRQSKLEITEFLLLESGSGTGTFD